MFAYSTVPNPLYAMMAIVYGAKAAIKLGERKYVEAGLDVAMAILYVAQAFH